MRSPRSQSTDRTGRGGFRQARLPRLDGWPNTEPPRVSPTAEAAIDRISGAANSEEGRHHRSRPILSRWLLEKDVVNAREKVHRLSDGERLNVKGSFLKPSGVVGDENERAETDLAALSQSAAGNHDDDDRKNLQLHQQVAKTPAPWWAPIVMVLRLTVERGVGMERQDLSYGEGVHTSLRVQALLGGSNSPTSRCPEAVDWIICV